MLARSTAKNPKRASDDGRTVARVTRACLVAFVVCGRLGMTPGVAAGQTEVNTCGQVFSGSGHLAADLDCGAFAGIAVTIQGGSLDLRGFVLTAGTGSGVACEKSCTVKSDPAGGKVIGTAGGAVGGNPPGPRTIKLLQVDADGFALGVSNLFGTVKLIDSSVTNSTFGSGDGVFAERARLIRSTVSGHAGKGVVAPRVKLVDSEVSGNGDLGVTADKLTARGSMILSNAQEGIVSGGSSGRVKLIDSAVSGNGDVGVRGIAGGVPIRVKSSDVSGNGAEGIFADFGKITVRDSTIDNNVLDGIREDGSRAIKVSESQVTGNGLSGVFQLANPGGCNVRATNSTITGNGLDASCSVGQTCADISTCELPTVSGTTCDTSYDTSSGFPGTNWGVCALD